MIFCSRSEAVKSQSTKLLTKFIGGIALVALASQCSCNPCVTTGTDGTSSMEEMNIEVAISAAAASSITSSTT